MTALDRNALLQQKTVPVDGVMDMDEQGLCKLLSEYDIPPDVLELIKDLAAPPKEPNVFLSERELTQPFTVPPSIQIVSKINARDPDWNNDGHSGNRLFMFFIKLVLTPNHFDKLHTPRDIADTTTGTSYKFPLELITLTMEFSMSNLHGHRMVEDIQNRILNPNDINLVYLPGMMQTTVSSKFSIGRQETLTEEQMVQNFDRLAKFLAKYFYKSFQKSFVYLFRFIREEKYAGNTQWRRSVVLNNLLYFANKVYENRKEIVDQNKRLAQPDDFIPALISGD